VTPPTTIQKISDYNFAPKLQSKRKSYVSRETMQRQARTGKSHKRRTIKAAEASDGFIEVKKKKNKVQQPSKKKHMVGVRVGKSQPNMYYRRVENKEKTNEKTQPKVNIPKVTTTNSFAALDEVNDDGQKSHGGDKVLNVSDSEVDEEIVMEESNGNRNPNSTKEASTPYVENQNDVDVVVLTQDDQAIHTRDFNAVLFLEDSTSGSSSIDISMVGNEWVIYDVFR
ncbi:hypothetical protein Tco_0536415, partial [Tanacetum coccineum]